MYNIRHIVKHEYTECPKCNSPAIVSEFKRILAVTPECPMCNTKVTEDEVIPVISNLIFFILYCFSQVTQLMILRNSLSQLTIKKKKIRITQMMIITMINISD